MSIEQKIKFSLKKKFRMKIAAQIALIFYKHHNMSKPHSQRDAARAVPTNTLLSRMRLFVVATADVVTV